MSTKSVSRIWKIGKMFRIRKVEQWHAVVLLRSFTCYVLPSLLLRLDVKKTVNRVSALYAYEQSLTK